MDGSLDDSYQLEEQGKTTRTTTRSRSRIQSRQIPKIRVHAVRCGAVYLFFENDTKE